ncbi:HdeD family acid-resistance protein [Brucellaceae bacterium C25G]
MLLLLGRDIIQHHWRKLFVIGLIWFIAGLSIFIDAIDGHTLIPSYAFGYFLLPEAVVSVIAGLGSQGTAKRMRLFQGILLFIIAILILMSSFASNFILAMIFGICFLIDGGVRIGSAIVVRYARWKAGLIAGTVEIILAIFVMQPWPTWYEGTIGCNVGAVMMMASVGVISIAVRIRRLKPGASITSLFNGDNKFFSGEFVDEPVDTVRGEVIVHVWTPTGNATTPLHQRAINRYIAAVDAQGVISTGHAALEMQPDIYISHYPAIEIERSPDEFGRILRATVDNDVPGRFLPSYREEADGWCESTVKVHLVGADIQKLRNYWKRYQQDTTYNLTNRNCSSSVAHALDAAFEGGFRERRWPLLSALGAISYPELWAAGLMRKRAETMAWTPGLVLDYARALSALVNPPVSTWRRLFRLKSAIH